MDDKERISPISLGLTGGVASGKSSVSKWLAKQPGVVVIDLDQIGRELLSESKSVQEGVAAICGNEICKDGKLNKQRIREIIFFDPEKKRRLEALLHPLIIDKYFQQRETLIEKDTEFIFCEAALLFESGVYKQLKATVVVLSSKENRIRRLQARDKIDLELAIKMIQAQTDDDKRVQLADFTLINDGSLEELEKATCRLLHELRKKYLTS